MYIGFLLILALILSPLIVMYKYNKQSINLKKIARILVFSIIYFALTSILHIWGLIPLNSFQIIFRFWPVLPIYYGLKNIWMGSYQSTASGVIIIILGFFFLIPVLEYYIMGESSNAVFNAFSKYIYVLFWPAAIIITFLTWLFGRNR